MFIILKFLNASKVPEGKFHYYFWKITISMENITENFQCFSNIITWMDLVKFRYWYQRIYYFVDSIRSLEQKGFWSWLKSVIKFEDTNFSNCYALTLKLAWNEKLNIYVKCVKTVKSYFDKFKNVYKDAENGADADRQFLP